MDVFAELSRVLDERRGADPESSYVASLYARGLNKILEKVGEEANELVIAAKDFDAAVSQGDAPKVVQDAVVKEMADLWFHNLVLLKQLGFEPEQVTEELARRFGVGGLEEKASRGS